MEVGLNRGRGKDGRGSRELQESSRRLRIECVSTACVCITVCRERTHSGRSSHVHHDDGCSYGKSSIG
jgi:hypothetical protein